MSEIQESFKEVSDVFADISSGVWKIRNKKTRTYINLRNSNASPGTPVIGYHNDNTPAMLWQVSYVDKDKGLVTFQTGVNGTTPLFINTEDQQLSSGTALVVAQVPLVFHLQSVGSGLYRINVVGSSNDLASALSDSKDYTPVRVETTNLVENNQTWEFLKF